MYVVTIHNLIVSLTYSTRSENGNYNNIILKIRSEDLFRIKYITRFGDILHFLI